jgi:uncharacterized protein (TIGR03382 family)
MRICIASAVLILAGGCLRDGIDRTQQGLGGYQPPEPAATTLACEWPDGGAHGTVDTDCANPMCDTGFGDCNARFADGCESNLADPSTCGDCATNCHECLDQATCVAGACQGKPRPDHAACRAHGCTVVGMCMGGLCKCPDDVDGGTNRPPLPSPRDDVHHPPNDGHGLPGDCSFTGGGTATASVVLLLGAVAMLFRRRRPNG